MSPLQHSDRGSSTGDVARAGWMELALAAAQEAAGHGEVPVGAVVVRGSEVLAVARNRKEADRDPSAHAEILALREAARRLGGWRLGGCTLVVTLEPCPMCLGAAQHARVDRLIYGAADPKGGALSLGHALHEDQRLNHRFPAEFQHDPRCEAILKEFFRARRAKTP
ncbi:MAG: nucleoside deaminase [Bdellovibrionales bacterium]|nr:nucleoside deaminase [Bdellovibrionales bacterium]